MSIKTIMHLEMALGHLRKVIEAVPDCHLLIHNIEEIKSSIIAMANAATYIEPNKRTEFQNELLNYAPDGLKDINLID